jgi:23S rRNA pseudouridine1911/1915/1917 synthase
MLPEVIFEDNHILVVNKPSGLLTQPSGTDHESLEAICKAYIKAKYKKPGAVFLEAVHRLDKPASGIVLFARTSKALSRLNETLRSKQCKKIYIAHVEGKLPTKEGTLEHYLKHDNHYAAIVDGQHPEAKLSNLHYRVIGHHPLGDRVEIA